MLAKELINPKSIVIVGGSNDIQKPGGKLIKNILENNFSGNLFIVNPKEENIQGIKCFKELSELPNVDLAVIAIAARFCPETVEYLAQSKGTRGFIIISAGFSEEGEAGAMLERKVVESVNKVNGTLIGPNCVGIMNCHHTSIFTTPIPKLVNNGCDFISGSGATAVFIMESAIPKGLTFSSVYSVGNSAQTCVEDILQHLDESFDPESSSKVKLIYLETVKKPAKLLKHAQNLISKGCKIAAIKAGSSDAGSRAASSHTGALASSDTAVDALFKKAGIVRCHSREELTTVAAIFMHKELVGKNIAIITHAGGPAVMLTDALSNGGFSIPHIEGEAAEELLQKLFPGSSVANPIDFLATGTASQLETIIDYCENKFNNIDAMVVIFGSPGLFPVFDVYNVLHEKMKICKKPIFPVLPSVMNVKDEIAEFLAKGRINFPDEVLLGNALSKVSTTNISQNEVIGTSPNHDKIRDIIKKCPKGYLEPSIVQELLDAAEIPRTQEIIVNDESLAKTAGSMAGWPLVMKVIGPVHKSDVGGVVLNVKNEEQLSLEFHRMMKIEGATGVLIQPMLSGIEVFAGIKREDNFGHMILCGMGGIYIEILKDVSYGLAPISLLESREMINNLKSIKLLKGARGKKGIDIELFAKIITRLSALAISAPEISEMDINPLLANENEIVAVDARIKID